MYAYSAHDRHVGLLRGLGDVRGGALVGDELHAGEPGGRVGQDALDQRGTLALADGERVEQDALAIADVLDADELEWHAEDAASRS